MERISKKIALSISLFVLLLCPEVCSGNKFVPDDLPTIEALIDAHKKMKRAEDLAVLELTAIEETHRLTDKAVAAYNNTRSILNKRLADANSYLMLAVHISNVAIKVARVVQNYADFTTTTYDYALKKPFVMVYYTKANYELAKESKHVAEMVAGFTASGLNLLKATMEENYKVLMQIENSIARMNRIIATNNMICRGMIHTGLKIWHVQDILSDKAMDSIANKIIALWIGNQSEG